LCEETEQALHSTRERLQAGPGEPVSEWQSNSK